MKVIVLDVDGTLLNSKGELLEETKTSLIRFQQQGGVIVLASGRSVENQKEIAELIEMQNFEKSFIIGINGQQLYQFKTNEKLVSQLMTTDETNQILTLTKKLHVPTLVYVRGDQYYYRTLKTRLKAWVDLKVFKRKEEEWYEKRKQYFTHIKTINHDFNDHVSKFVLIVGEKRMNEVINTINNQTNSHFQLLPFTKNWLEIMPKGINKGKTLNHLMNLLEVTKDEVFVFGDGINDLEMMEVVTNSYAMGNANEEVKARAKYTTKSNDENGIGIIVDQYLN